MIIGGYFSLISGINSEMYSWFYFVLFFYLTIISKSSGLIFNIVPASMPTESSISVQMNPIVSYNFDHAFIFSFLEKKEVLF